MRRAAPRWLPKRSCSHLTAIRRIRVRHLGAALEDRASWCGLIVDLHHVSAASLKVAIAAKGTERMMLVTDAMATVGTDLTEFMFQGQRVMRAGGAPASRARRHRAHH